MDLARWGLSARSCGPADAEQAIVSAGALSNSAHGSREEFSAGCASGRVLRFDEAEYGPSPERTSSHPPSADGERGQPVAVSQGPRPLGHTPGSRCR
ncbi:DUF1266 domain-containing protein [Streptomyces sp. NPDC059611]|uniref:DUF1266 domain-containing protein n=1 Tax=Streptomyces sp. NPDC059611 TaxID=3346884 RepID=UPI0036BB93CF